MKAGKRVASPGPARRCRPPGRRRGTAATGVPRGRAWVDRAGSARSRRRCRRRRSPRRGAGAGPARPGRRSLPVGDDHLAGELGQRHPADDRARPGRARRRSGPSPWPARAPRPAWAASGAAAVGPPRPDRPLLRVRVLAGAAERAGPRAERPREPTVPAPYRLIAPVSSRSAPIVVSSPWPVCTTVSSGSGSSRSRIERHDQVGVAEGPAGRTRAALEQGVAGEHAAEVVRRRSRPRPARARACAAPSARCRRPRSPARRTGRRPRAGRGGSAPTAAGRRGAAGSARRPRRRSAGATRTWSSWAWVHTIALHRARRRPRGSRRRRAGRR